MERGGVVGAAGIRGPRLSPADGEERPVPPAEDARESLPAPAGPRSGRDGKPGATGAAEPPGRVPDGAPDVTDPGRLPGAESGRPSDARGPPRPGDPVRSYASASRRRLSDPDGGSAGIGRSRKVVSDAVSTGAPVGRGGIGGR